MSKIKTIFECQFCGNQQSKWLGKCPECNSFNNYVEIKQKDIEILEQIKINSKIKSKAKEINEIEIENINRISTKSEELDIVLGGGIVEGSLILIGGSPGIGKSTLLLKIASNLSEELRKVLYVSGEESASQIKMRAQRLNSVKKNLFLLTEINLENIMIELSKNDYKILVIDSIQTIFSDKVTSAPGSVTQVREITFELMRYAKENKISIFIIGHITKDGSIAGPRILEHMVDVVLYFEGDNSKEFRVLRGFKNRFGSTSEIGIFEMTNEGLMSAKNITSKFFTKGKDAIGSAVTITMEGSRALIIEIQALVCESTYPKRSSTGYDRNRLDMILALLEKKLGLSLSHYDVFINVIGGVKITEPACDLAVVTAIVSSFKNRAISKESVFIGEVSLNGEIRDIFNLDARLKEASIQNFKNAIIPIKPKNNQNLKIYTTNQIEKILDWM